MPKTFPNEIIGTLKPPFLCSVACEQTRQLYEQCIALWFPTGGGLGASQFPDLLHFLDHWWCILAEASNLGRILVQTKGNGNLIFEKRFRGGGGWGADPALLFIPKVPINTEKRRTARGEHGSQGGRLPLGYNVSAPTALSLSHCQGPRWQELKMRWAFPDPFVKTRPRSRWFLTRIY